MPDYLTPEQFLDLRQTGLPVLDARSPTEYAAGHIPGSLNTPVLMDDERVAVGKTYFSQGQEAAVHLALELVGPNLVGRHNIIQEQLELFRQNHSPTGKKILIHCWRGGQRSLALAWLLESTGYHPLILDGGYKAYRVKVRSDLASPRKVLVLGGCTGSGKTSILHELSCLGHQAVDLEDLAGHRGSSFGGIGLPEQLCGEMMENKLRDLWTGLDPNRPVWVEDEDRRIGKINICPEFFRHIEDGCLIWLEVPRECRIRNLVALYAEKALDKSSQHEFCLAIDRVQSRLGTQKASLAKRAVVAGDMETAVSLVLEYYDKAYQKQSAKRIIAAKVNLTEVCSGFTGQKNNFVNMPENIDASGGISATDFMGRASLGVDCLAKYAAQILAGLADKMHA